MKIFAFLAIIFALPVFAQVNPGVCQLCFQTEFKLEELEKLTQPFRRYNFLKEKAQVLYDAHTYLRKSLAPLARTLRDGKSEPTYESSRKTITEIKEDFDRLVVLQRESLIIADRISICATACSPLRRLELEKDLRNVQNLKSMLFLKRPILASRIIEKRLSSLSDKDLQSLVPVPQKLFESGLKDALFESIGVVESRIDKYAKFLNDPNQPVIKSGSEKYTEKYLSRITSNFPEVIEDLLRISHPTPDSCFFAEDFKNYDEKKKLTSTAIDISLFLAPLLAGPIGAEAAIAIRLSSWGIQASMASKATRGMALVFEASLIAKDKHSLLQLENGCRRKEGELFLSPSQAILNELEECRKKYGEELFISNLGVLASGIHGLSAIKKIPTTFTSKAIPSEQIGPELLKNGIPRGSAGYVTPDKGVFTIMDLGAKNPEVKKIPEQYWRYVGNIYNERLNLSPQEIEKFIQSSLEMSPRTTLIMNTEKSLLSPELKIKGGVGIVSAEKSSELLPFEKATGVRIDRKPGEKIAEVVRLTVGKNPDAVELSQRLIAQAIAVIRNDKDISRTFIFTSKIHGRLYRRIGIPADKIKVLDDRDVMIEIGREDLDKIAKASQGY